MSQRLASLLRAPDWPAELDEGADVQILIELAQWMRLGLRLTSEAASPNVRRYLADADKHLALAVSSLAIAQLFDDDAQPQGVGGPPTAKAPRDG
jgi:hypothetical protein